MLSEEQKEELFEVCGGIFSKKSIEAITLKDIAEESGISEKDINEEYKTVEDLLESIIVQGIEESTKLFIRMVDARGKADIKLIRLVRELLKQYEKHAPLFRLISLNFITLDDVNLGIQRTLSNEDINRYRQNTAILGRIIAQGQSEGLFARDIDPLESAYILRGMILAAIQYWELLHKDEPLHSHADLVTREFLKGVYK